MIILLILLFILAILKIIENDINEGFEEELSKDIINDYNEFKKFYNVFMSNWKKAVITSLSLNKEPDAEKPTKPMPTDKEMNVYIKTLSEKLGELPKVTNPFPDEIDKITLQKIFVNIPDKPDGYINALTWMNKNLKEALSSVQGFEDMCKNAHKCIEKEQKQNEDIMVIRIKKLLADETLKRLMKENIDLVKQADDVKKKAESGELASEYKSDEKSSPKPEMPPGGDLLSKLKKIDPAAYDAKIKENPTWGSLKNQLEEINSVSK